VYGKEVIDHDIIREEDIVSFGIKVIRFKNSEIRMGIEDIINELKANGNNKEK